MQGIFTKILIGLILVSLVIFTGTTFIIDSANNYNIDASSIENLEQSTAQTAYARQIVTDASNKTAQSGIEDGQNDIASAVDAIDASKANLEAKSLLSSFFEDIQKVIPLSNTFILAFGAILTALTTAAIAYIILGRNI